MRAYDSSAGEFFRKCCIGILTVDDFNFDKGGQESSEIMSSVRRKINVPPDIFSLMNTGTLAEEDFSKNKIQCVFATSTGTCTLGFTGGANNKPMTLLKGNELDLAMADHIELVLRRKAGASTFDIILAGYQNFLRYYPSIAGVVAESLLPRKTMEENNVLDKE